MKVFSNNSNPKINTPNPLNKYFRSIFSLWKTFRKYLQSKFRGTWKKSFITLQSNSMAKAKNNVISSAAIFKTLLKDGLQLSRTRLKNGIWSWEIDRCCLIWSETIKSFLTWGKSHLEPKVPRRPQINTFRPLKTLFRKLKYKKKTTMRFHHHPKY